MIRKRAIGILGFFFLVAWGIDIAKAWGEGAVPLSKEIARLAQEAPSLEQFPGKGAMILQHKANFSLRADGAMVKIERWIVQLTSKTPESWTTWDVAVPPGGEARVTEAGMYSYPFGNLLNPLLPTKKDYPGLSFMRVQIPYLKDNTVFSFEYEQVFPRRFDVGYALWLQYDLPLWENDITLGVPEKTTLYWHGPAAGNPEVKKEKSRDRYAWRIINSNPWEGGGLVAHQRPSLVFSLRRGGLGSLKELENYETLAYPALPKIFLPFTQDFKLYRGGTDLLRAMSDQKYLMTPGNSSLVRSPEDIPSSGPWTQGERALIAQSWLKRMGWEVVLWWLPLFPMGEDTPGPREIWKQPVLECHVPGESSFLYSFGQTVSFGRTPPSLWGQRLYRARGARVETLDVPEGDLEDHRLTLGWNIRMDETGEARGVFDLYVRGGWVDLFGKDAWKDPRKALSLLRMNVPYTVTGEISKDVYDYGYHFEVPVSLTLGIPGEGQVLARVPGADLPWVDEAFREEPPFDLRFPFVLEQSFMLDIPKNFHLVGRLAKGESKGPISVKGDMYYNKRHSYIEGDRRVIVKTIRMNLGDGELFKEVLRRWTDWKSIFIPLKK